MAILKLIHAPRPDFNFFDKSTILGLRRVERGDHFLCSVERSLKPNASPSLTPLINRPFWVSGEWSERIEKLTSVLTATTLIYAVGAGITIHVIEIVSCERRKKSKGTPSLFPLTNRSFWGFGERRQEPHDSY